MSFFSSFKKAALILSAYMIPVFLIGKYYRDDYARLVFKFFGWDWAGRPLANVIVYAVNFGYDLADISPFAQILVIIVCSATCAMVATYLIKDTSFLSVACISFLFISPFYLQNLMYRFDAITMSFSILVCALPFIRADAIDSKTTAAVSFICMLMVLLIYQASIPVFFILVLLELIVTKKYHTDDFKRVLVRVTAAAAAIAIYTFLISPALVQGLYASGRSAIPDIADGLLGTLILKIALYFYFASSLASGKWWAVFFIPLLAMAVMLSRFVLNNKEEQKAVLSLSIACSALWVSVLMFFVLENPAYEPRAMIGFSAIIMTVMCLTFFLLKDKQWLAAIVIITPMAYYFSMATNFVNAARSQYEYEKSLVNMIATDVNRMSDRMEVVIHGIPKETLVEKSVKNRFEVFKYILKPDIGWWMTSEFAMIETPILSMVRGVEEVNAANLCGVVKKRWNGHYMIIERKGIINISLNELACPGQARY